MRRLIDADKLKETLTNLNVTTDGRRKVDLAFNEGVKQCITRAMPQIIDDESTVDAEPIVHAIWELKTRLPFCSVYVCSKCGREISIGPNETLIDYPFCHCGAKMNEEV